MKNTTKQTITAVAVASSLFAVSSASADLQGISIDEVESGHGIGTTYQVYADVDTGDQVNTISGNSTTELRIYTDSAGGFYQNTYGSYGPSDPDLFPFFEKLEFDSFITIGLLSSTEADNEMADFNIDWSVFEAGGALEVDNGLWYTLPGTAQSYEIDGRVLLGQFTTTGDIFGTINISGKNADGTSWVYDGVELPAPGAIILLGLAGLATGRRRR